MRKKDYPVDPNSLLIPRIIDEPRRGPSMWTTKKTEAKGGERFSVLQTSPISKESVEKKEDKSTQEHKSSGSASMSDASVEAKSDDQHKSAYEMLREKRMEEIRKGQQARTSSQGPSPEELRKAETEKAVQRQKDDQMYAQANDLQNKLEFWKQQKGQTQYDNGTVEGMINQLQNDLNGIPTRYWRP